MRTIEISLLLVVQLLLSIGNSQAQNLNGTKWIITDTNDFFFRYGFINNDSLFLSVDDAIYTNFQKFEYYSDTIYSTDISGICIGGGFTKTAHYKTQLTSDSLFFIEVKDSCYFRYDVFVKFKWGKRLTGIDHFNNELSIKAYPNPVFKKLYLENPIKESILYQIYNTKGKLISEGKAQSAISFETYSSGIYFLVINHRGIRNTFRILKE